MTTKEETVATRLAALMAEAKWSATDLVFASKRSPRTLDKVLSGATSNPTLDTLQPIAAALSRKLGRIVTAQELRGETDDRS